MANETATILDISFNTTEGLNGLDALIAKSLELAEKKKQLVASMKEEQKAVSEAAKAMKEGSSSQAEYAAILDKSAKAQIELKKDLNETNAAIASNNADVKTSTTLMKAQAGSANQLKAQLATNTKELNAMSAAQRLSTEEGQKLSDETKEISDKLKEMEGAVGNNTRNVGNYSESVKDAFEKTGQMGGATGKLSSAMTNSIGSIKAFGAALKANPIMLIVTAVLGLISAVGALMKRNSELSNSLSAAFKPFQLLFEAMLDKLTEFIGAFGKAITWVSGHILKLGNAMGVISDETLKAANMARELELNTLAIYNAETANIVAVAELRREYESLKTLSADQNKTTAERVRLNQEALGKLAEIEAAEVGLLKTKYDQIKAENSLTYSSKEAVRAEAEALATLNEAQAGFQTQRKELIGQISGLQKAASDKALADEKTTAAERLAIMKATAALATESQLKATEEMIKIMDEQLTGLALKHREAELTDDTGKIKLANLIAYNEEAKLIEQTKLENDLITHQEYLNAIAEMDLAEKELRLENEEAEKERIKERDALNLEYEMQLREAKAADEFAFQQEKLDNDYQLRVEEAKRLGGDLVKLDQIYAEQSIKIEREKMKSKLEMASKLAGDVSGLLGEESKVGKAFAVVQATINTYLGATKALATGGIFGIAQAAVVIAFGMKQVATIVKQKDPDTKISKPSSKFEKGGQVTGASHSAGGVTFTGDNGQVFEAEGGENMYVLNRGASAAINALGALNGQFGGVNFGTSSLYSASNLGNLPGGQVAQAQNQTVTLSSQSIASLAGVVIESIIGMPNPVVGVTDINEVNTQLRNTIVAATM